jgi:endonuclease III
VPLARATLGPLPVAAVAAVAAVAYAAGAADGAAAAAAPSGAKVAGAELGDSAAAVAAAVAASEATRARYESCAAAFEPLTAENVERKMQSFNTALEAVYGELPFTRLDWSTSVLGTLVGLICAQTCRNSWSSIGYANLAATFPSAELPNEPDWDLIRQRRPEDIEPSIWHGPYFHMKAERIHALLGRVFEDSGGVATSLERLHQWPSDQIRRYLLSYNGLSGKSIACLLLYRMGRVDFAVDANVLIYERIREETRNGKGAFAALDAGFDRAYSTIIDSYVTHLIAVALLFLFGSGPVRGFAVALGIGVLTTLFTAVSVVRVIMVVYVRRARPKQLAI